MQPLSAKLVKFYFFSEVSSNDFFDFFTNWWFEHIFVDFFETVDLTWKKKKY